MNILKLDYQGLPIHANREAWFNATGIAEQHGKRLDNFFSLKRTQQYIQALAKRKGLIPCDSRELKKPFNPTDYPALIQTRRGRYNSGTWLHPDLMICFARFNQLGL